MHSGEKSHVEKALENFLQLENIYVTINLNFIYYKKLAICIYLFDIS